MTTHESGQPYPSDELERLQSLGFERITSSNLVMGGGLLIEKSPDSQHLYAPFGRIDSERVEAIRLSDKFMGREANGLCLQVMQESTPERVARQGEEKEFLELTANGSGGSMWGEDENTARSKAELEALAQKSVAEQLEESGFAIESSEDETSVMRYRSYQGELVAIVEGNHLKGIFVAPDQTERSSRNLDPEQLEIIGIGEFEGFLDTDPIRHGVKVSNGWAEFIIDPKYPSWPQQPRIVREPTLEELGIVPIEPVTEQTGFTQGGANDTEAIRQLASINGVPISRLEADMQPATMSGAGFLGEGERLIDVLARDNEIVTTLGLTHQEVALPLRYIEQLYRLGMIQQSGFDMPAAPGVNEFTIGGHSYKVGVVAWRGYQESPFRDNTRTDHDFTILNLETGHSIRYSGLLTELIGRYGFYEGTGTPYRTAPEDIIKTFSHLNERVTEQSEGTDPVVALTSGQSNEAILTSNDHVTRFRNLFEAGVSSVKEASVSIRFSSSTDVLAFLNNEANAALLPYLDTETLQELEPNPLHLRGYSSVETFIGVLGRLDEETQHQVINLISTIDTSKQESWMRNSTLEKLLEASVKEEDGTYAKQPVADLIERIDYSSAEFLQAFYKAAGGRYSEWVTHKIDEPRGTRHSKVELDEERTRALSSAFGNQVMPFIEAFREAMRIDADQPEAEQIIAFLKKYHTIEKAQGISLYRKLVRLHDRPD